MSEIDEMRAALEEVLHEAFEHVHPATVKKARAILAAPRPSPDKGEEVWGAPEYVIWLRGLAEKGGKGAVNNIDARALGRIADVLAGHSAAVARARAEAFEEAAEIADDWLARFGERAPKYVSGQKWASDSVRDIAEAIRARSQDDDE